MGELERRETTMLIGKKNHGVREIVWSHGIVKSSAVSITRILWLLWSDQLWKRTDNKFKLYKSAWQEELVEEVAHYRLDKHTNIIDSMHALQEAWVELAHPWTVITLRTQKSIRDMVQRRQELGITEVLLAGHFMNIKPDWGKVGSPTDVFYTQDTFWHKTLLDQTRPKVDGPWLREGTVIWVWTKAKAGARIISTSTAVPALPKGAEVPVG
jgi:hypothetical protein